MRRCPVVALSVVLSVVGPALRGQTYTFAPLAGTAELGSGVYGVATTTPFYANGVAITAGGEIIFTNAYSHAIHRITTAGVISVFAGAAAEPGHADGPLALARFSNPRGLALDSAGNYLVADYGNCVVRKISPAGVVSTLAGQPGAGGLADGSGPAARFSSLRGLAVGPTGDLFVLDQNPLDHFRTLIRKVTAAGLVTTLFTPTSAEHDFFALGVDSAGAVFATSWLGHAIYKITSQGGVSLFAGTPGKPGSTDGTGRSAAFNEPAGLAIDPGGNVFVADRSNSTLRRIAPDGTVTTIAGQVDADRYLIADGDGGNARFRYPEDVKLDAAGHLYVLDAYGTIARKGTVTTRPAPPIVTSPLGGLRRTDAYRDVGARATVTLDPVVTGSEPLAYQWLRNSLPLAGATNATLVLRSVATSDQGTYAVAVSNRAGSFTTQPLLLRVFDPAFEAFTPRHTTSGGAFLWSVASGGGQLVTVGTAGKILTSGDGRTWTPRSSGTNEWLVGVASGGGKFVAVGDRGLILVSTDASAWRRIAASPTAQRLNNVAYGEGRFVAVGEQGTLISSSDGETWVAQASGTSGWLRGLAYVPLVPQAATLFGDNGTGHFYASGQGGVILMSSAGAWSREINIVGVSGDQRDLEALADGPIGIGQDGVLVGKKAYEMWNKFGAVLPDGTYVRTGSFISYWTRYEVGLNARFRGLARGAGAVFATGEGGLIGAAPDVTGPWSFIPTGTTANLVSGTFHGNSLFVVGENETVLQSQPLYPSRLINLATRGQVDARGDPLISGFVVSGSAPKTILLRAAGPSLAAFGLEGALATPVLSLFNGAGQTIAVNRGWSSTGESAGISEAGARVGAFPFAPGSADAALLVTLPPGSYTAQVSAGSTGGLVLFEAYDADTEPSAGSRAINLSTRGYVGTDANRLVAGFVLNGAASRRVLIRAIGPSLAQFGLSGVLAEPQLDLFDRNGNRLRRTTAWSAETNPEEIRDAAILAGAFALGNGSRDSAIIATLLPGSYTVHVSGLNNTTGLAIVELYDLP